MSELMTFKMWLFLFAAMIISWLIGFVMGLQKDDNPTPPKFPKRNDNSDFGTSCDGGMDMSL